MKILVITGPTSLGKTALAMKIAEHSDLEIINADAFQVYKFMDIGTAKPSKSELKKVKHHLIDILNPDEKYSAGKFFEHCTKIIPDILKKGKIPLVAGGTGLYIKCLTEGMCRIDAKDETIYRNLEDDWEKFGNKNLYARLKDIDPHYASAISENDKLRILRGLEAFLVTGIPFSDIHKHYHTKLPYDFHVAVLFGDRPKMYEKINLRVKEMFKAGWIDEVERLLKMGYSENSPAFRALGYKEIAKFIQDGGKIDNVINIISQKTRNYAKRQVTWFRHRNDVTFYNADKLSVEDFIKNMAQ